MKIKRIILILLFPLIAAGIKGQVNHVLNYSFEGYADCAGQIGNCTGTAVGDWYCPSNTYYNWFGHLCGTVPQNPFGYQYARTGQCYAGLEPIGAGNTVAYITGTLSDSLKATVKYCVTFYVSLADSDWWATNSIGAYFSNDSICAGNNYNVLPYTPQIENPASNFITNKVDWVPVSGEFQASGGEIFITLGGFQNTTPANTDSVGHGGFVLGENSEVQSFYYVDDVYVRMLTIANAGKNDSICKGDSVLIGKDTTTMGVSFSWLPIAGLSNPNIAQPIASPTVTTTYTLTVVNDSIHGCNCPDSVTIDSVQVFVYPAMNVTTHFLNDTGSNSGSAAVYVTGGSQPYTYLWKPGGQTTDSITGLGGSVDTCIVTDSNGCTYIARIVVKNTTGINNITSGNEQIQIYPNPSTGIFTIQSPMFNIQSAVVEVYNVFGEKVLTSPLLSNTINLTGKPSGVYFYKVLKENGELISNGKLLIE